MGLGSPPGRPQLRLSCTTSQAKSPRRSRCIETVHHLRRIQTVFRVEDSPAVIGFRELRCVVRGARRERETDNQGQHQLHAGPHLRCGFRFTGHFNSTIMESTQRLVAGYQIIAGEVAGRTDNVISRQAAHESRTRGRIRCHAALTLLY